MMIIHSIDIANPRGFHSPQIYTFAGLIIEASPAYDLPYIPAFLPLPSHGATERV